MKVDCEQLLWLFQALLDDRVCPREISVAMSPRTNLHVAEHLGVRLPASPPPLSPRRRRTLRHRGLPKCPLKAGTQLREEESEKCRKKAFTTASKTSITESEAPPTVCANLFCKITVTSNLVDELHNRDINHQVKYCNCGTSASFSTD